MLRLRPYKACDAERITSWIKNEEALRKWSADRFGSFPLTPEKLNEKYLKNNGDSEDPDNFFPMVAFDEDGIVGHLILRFADSEKSVVRFGFVIIDDSIRGMGYGKEMLRLAINYGFNILKASKITLGVFENNTAAYYCYKSSGFTECKNNSSYTLTINGKSYDWNCIEMELLKK